jgi:hypothetical protein
MLAGSSCDSWLLVLQEAPFPAPGPQEKKEQADSRVKSSSVEWTMLEGEVMRRDRAQDVTWVFPLF